MQGGEGEGRREAASLFGTTCCRLGGGGGGEWWGVCVCLGGRGGAPTGHAHAVATRDGMLAACMNKQHATSPCP